MSRLRTVRFLWGVGLTSLLLLVLKFMMARPTESDSVAYLEEKDLPASTALHGPVLGRARTALITKPPIINRTAESQEPKCPQQKHIEPWFRLPDDRTETYLVFYGKPIMQILRTITSLRGWKMKLILRDSPEGLEELQGLVALDRLLVVFTTSKSFHHKLLRALANSTNVLIGSIENAFKVTGAKRAQLTVFRNHFQTFGCSLEDAAIMPRSFILDDPMECIQFFKYGNTHPQSWWVLKPSNGQGGDGISIHSNLTALYSKYATCMKKSDSIIQEYVLSPLLLQNRKFDIRAFILIAQTSPYYLLFYHEGYLRVSVKEFDLHGGREAHLTNSHVQIAVEGFSMSEHFWSFQKLQEYLNEHLPVENEDFVSSRLIPFIKKVGLFILQSGILTTHHPPIASYCIYC